MIRIANKYELKKIIGQGGFGKVYLAEHVDLKVFYAIKLIRVEKAMEADFMERFKREAQILTRLLHRNSIPLRDFGKTTEGYFYMAMDYCPGLSLREILNTRGALPPKKVLELTFQILDVLEEAHKLGIVHRDLKPENIMIQQDGQGNDLVKVLDFGIAKLSHNLDEEGLNSVTLTKKDSIVGSPMYMSPEQATNEGIDGRSDIYSLGMMMYQMLTGKLPFASQTDVQTLVLQMNQYPDPFGQAAPDLSIPPWVEQAVFKAIHKDPAQRFPNATHFKAICLRIQNSLYSPSQISSGSCVVGETHSSDPAFSPQALQNPLSPTGSTNQKTLLSSDPAGQTRAKLQRIQRKSHISAVHKSEILGRSSRGASQKFKVLLLLVLMGVLSGTLLVWSLSKTHSIPVKNGAKKWVTKAKTALKDGDFYQARKFAQRALKLSPSSKTRNLLNQIRGAECDVFLAKARRAFRSKKYKQAQSWANKVLKINYLSREGARLLKKARDLQKYRTLMEKGKKALAQKDSLLAIKYIQKALKIQTTLKGQILLDKIQGMAFYDEALALEKQGNYKEALFQYQRAYKKMQDFQSKEGVERMEKKLAGPSHTFPLSHTIRPIKFWKKKKWKKALARSSNQKMFRHNLSLDGVYPSSGILPKGKVRWSKGAGQVYCQPVIYRGVIYFGSVSGCYVAAWDAYSGKEIWRVKTKNAVFASPAIFEDKLFVGDKKGILYGIHIKTGKVFWKFKTHAPLYGSPVVVKGRVIFALVNRIAVFRTDGSPLWNQRVPGPMQSMTPAFWKGVLYGVSLQPRGAVLWAMSLKGKYRWMVPLEDPAYQRRYSQIIHWYSSPSVSKGVVFITNYVGSVYAIHGSTGKILWTVKKFNSPARNFRTGFWISSPAIWQNKVYFGSIDGNLYCLNAKNGEELWKFSTKQEIFSSPSVADGRVYFGNRGGNLYCLDGQKGSLLWKVRIGSWVEGGAAIYKGVVYTGHMGGTFWAIK